MHEDLILVGSDGQLGHVYGFARATGTLVWRYEAGAGGLRSDLLRLGKSLVAVTADEGLVALDAATGAKRWSFPLKAAPYTSPGTDGDHVYVVSDDGALHAIGGATGKVLWKIPLGAAPSGAIEITGRSLFAGTSKTSWDDPWSTSSPGSHSLHRVDTVKEKIIARIPLPAKPLGRPLIARGRVVLYAGNQLLALDRKGTQVAWKRLAAHQNRVPRLQYWNGSIVAPSDPKEVVAVDPETGDVAWRQSVPASVTTLRAADDALYVGAGEALYAYTSTP